MQCFRYIIRISVEAIVLQNSALQVKPEYGHGCARLNRRCFAINGVICGDLPSVGGQKGVFWFSIRANVDFPKQHFGTQNNLSCMFAIEGT
jgi:hypothetical protein